MTDLLLLAICVMMGAVIVFGLAFAFVYVIVSALRGKP